MNRRGLLKTAGLCLAAACLPKTEWGEEMRYGDLLAKLASGQTLSPGEIEQLRLWGNNEENILSRVNTVAGQSAGLDPNVFQNSNMFSTLPHECGSMYNSNVQAASSAGVLGTLVGGAAVPSGANWQHGMRVDSTAGIIYLDGLNRDAVVAIWTWVTWSSAVPAGTDVHLQWNANDGSILYKREDYPTLTFGAFTQQLTHFRRVGKAETSYYITAGTDNANQQNITNFMFGMARLY